MEEGGTRKRKEEREKKGKGRNRYEKEGKGKQMYQKHWFLTRRKKNTPQQCCVFDTWSADVSVFTRVIS